MVPVSAVLAPALSRATELTGTGFRNTPCPETVPVGTVFGMPRIAKVPPESADAELAETVAHVALNTLSNYFSHLARPDLDFPAAPTLDASPLTMDLTWQNADLLELCDSYTADDANGVPTGALKNVRIAVQGGYLHIAHPGADRFQIVSAPGVRRAVYTASAEAAAAATATATAG
jgi:hypothetical protein